MGLLLALGLGDLLAERLLLGPLALEVGQRRPAALVGRQHGVDEGLVLAAGALAGAGGVRVLAEQAQIDHEVEGIEPARAGR